HQMTFGEALRYLAEQAGVKLTERTRRRSKHDAETAVERSHIKDANETAQKFFRGILRHPEHGQPARDLIERRGISPDMVEAFGIGASPDRWDGLELFITTKDLEPNVFLAAGLLKQRDSGTGRYDALRNRLVFPIRDQIGRTIAFGARRINDEDEPKYLNSPETPLFDKSATLFGLDLAHRAIQRSGTAVIAEGYTDVIACHQAGITNVVATLGTALTPNHATKLQQLCDTVILLFDGDEAGQRAADRAAEVFLARPIDVRIATLAGATEAKDPDELLKLEGGDDILRSVFDNAIDLLSFRDARLRTELAGAGPARIEARVRDEMRELGRLGLASADKIRWQFVIRQLHDITGLDTATIAALVREGTGRRPAQPEDTAPAAPTTRARTPIVEALACLLADPTIYVGLTDATKQSILNAAANTELANIAQALAAVADRSASPTLTAILDELTEQRLDAAPAIALERDIVRRLGEDPELIRATFETCMQRITPPAETTKAASPLDRIAELKAARTGEHATDRTRLPRTRQ
ncbi:MAG: toprim domain-containing protein, partial [Planctomycetota bacterium]